MVRRRPDHLGIVADVFPIAGAADDRDRARLRAGNCEAKDAWAAAGDEAPIAPSTASPVQNRKKSLPETPHASYCAIGQPRLNARSAYRSGHSPHRKSRMAKRGLTLPCVL